MNMNCANAHPAVLNPCPLISFYQASATKPQKGIPVRHTLDELSTVSESRAVDFESLMDHYYPPPGHCPCRVDALTFQRDGTYLVEFKSEKADQAQLFRKLYDSLMLLIEHDGWTFAQSRRELTYIVVSSGLPPWNWTDRALSRAYGYCRDPWDKLQMQYDHWILVPLEGVVVKKVYSMPPNMFNYYAIFKKWK